MIRILGLILGITLISCGDQMPSGILKPQQMQAVLWDMLRADEVVVQKPYDSTITALDKSTTVYQQVFAIHRISKESFQKSLAYYKMRPELLRPILDSLSKKADSSTVNPVKPALAKDSVVPAR